MKLPSLIPSYDYIPALNGLRAIAVLFVLVAHLGFSHLIPGGFGVTLFFFISGMLITRLLLAEFNYTNTINIKLFYLRRILRLYPALVVAIALSTFIIWLMTGHINNSKILASLFYYINFYGIYVGFGQDISGFDPLSILWSLAIEEQYYLLFPLLLLPFAGQLKKLFFILLSLTIVVVVWRTTLHLQGASSDLIYMRTDTRIDSILYGCLFTLLIASQYGQSIVKVLSHPLCFLSGIVIILLSFIIRSDDFRDTIRYTIQGIALFPIVATLCFSHRLSHLQRIAEWPIMTQIGIFSYSLYLFHPIAIMIAEHFWGNGSLGITHMGIKNAIGFIFTATPLAFILAISSYYFVEKPMLRLRHHFGSHLKGTQ